MHSVIHWKKLFCIVVFLVGEGGCCTLQNIGRGNVVVRIVGGGGGGERGGLDVNSINQRRACCLIIVVNLN